MNGMTCRFMRASFKGPREDFKLIACSSPRVGSLLVIYICEGSQHKRMKSMQKAICWTLKGHYSGKLRPLSWLLPRASHRRNLLLWFREVSQGPKSSSLSKGCGRVESITIMPSYSFPNSSICIYGQVCTSPGTTCSRGICYQDYR